MALSLRESLDHYLSLPAIPIAEAYAHVLAWKGTILGRQQRLRTLRTDPRHADTFKEWERLTGELSTLAFSRPYPEDRDVWIARFRELTAKRAQTEARLATAQAEIKSLPPATPAQVAAALPADAALIDLLEFNRRVPARGKPGEWDEQRCLTAFVLRPGKPVERFELGPIEPIAKSVDAWLKENEDQDKIDIAESEKLAQPGDSKEEMNKQRERVTNKNTPPHLARLAVHGKLLRSTVWEPLDPALSQVKTVLISPDGVLCRFPIAALPGKAPGAFLIEDDLTLTLLPTPALLATAQAPPKGKGLYGIGGVDYGGSPGLRDAPVDRGGPFSFGPLDGTKKEMQRVHEIFKERFPDEAAAVFNGPGATEATFRREAPRARWIHLATHGYYAADAQVRALGPTHKLISVSFHPGLLTGVAFAGVNTPSTAREDDALLSSLEVASMDLSGVELAALSACKTGQGKATSGEGVLGLQRAFQAAGARSVLATLWSVDDTGTYLLMARFYDNLWGRKMTKAAALREAQIWLIRSGRQEANGPIGYMQRPQVWSAVVLSGEPK